MNSSNDKQMDRQLDQLLSKSVGANAAPVEFSTAPLPSRPRFSWMLYGAMASLIILISVFSVVAALYWKPDAAGVSYALSDGIYTTTEYLMSSTFLAYVAATMAVVYGWFARKLIRLYRYY